jgi:hypothetical protein
LDFHLRNSHVRRHGCRRELVAFALATSLRCFCFKSLNGISPETTFPQITPPLVFSTDNLFCTPNGSDILLQTCVLTYNDADCPSMLMKTVLMCTCADETVLMYPGADEYIHFTGNSARRLKLWIKRE